MTTSICYITSIFGTNFKNIKPCPVNHHSYFFTNNVNLKKTIISNGWNFYYVNMPLSNELLTCSLQSKYIKFLIFLKDFPEFKKKYKKILYFDHKYYLSYTNQVKLVNQIFNQYPNHIFIVRGHKDPTRKLKREIKYSKKQPRYALNIEKTINFLIMMNKYKNCFFNAPVYLTGIIFYNNIEKSLEITQQVYNLCIEHQQPQCQIYFAAIIHHEKYLGKWKSFPYRRHKFIHIKE